MKEEAQNGPSRAAGKRPPADAAAGRPPFPVLPWVAATAMDAVAAALLLWCPARTAAAVVAGLLHVLAALPLATARALGPSERGLAAALALTLPVVGAPLAALTLGTTARSEIAQQPPGEAAPLEVPDPDEVGRMAEALPSCETLLDGGPEERRAVLSALTRRADADALVMLRWALGAPDPDLAVEAALALEDINASFEARLAAARREARERPSFEAAMAAAEVAAHAIDAGIADPSLVPLLAHEARSMFEEAARLDPVRHDAVALARAKLELAVLRPDTALACIDGALATAANEGRGALLALRDEAVLASHTLPWEGPSALASYHETEPPPLTARRLMPRVPRDGRGTRGSRATKLPPRIEPTRTTTSPHLTLVPKPKNEAESD
jgi:hypothetical protein